MDETLSTVLHWTTRSIEIAGIFVIVVGTIIATITFLKRRLVGDGSGSYHEFRASLGRSILLGLEFLVAADIINTVAIEPTLESVAVLAGVVLVRTFLSFALEIEIEGRLPWKKGTSTGRQQ
ncbi:DUF1622 domain-containing protein [Fulvimarina sp. 2208YS6-2-32]|uniref:DUF1622 domain-containing protein n=1 Tax=Fulvimarina uroteuthidis TaxID=3098149 RepID=A0ABU5I7G1_9HYPH|nr:DUF1622 domain-containing protein [Fulvimarina sp. 2208YS6-2-32]MDY8110136.1 DUF1622 domain-containing protein [Fulvimarina sp. 2208YS6-2-32]